MTPPTKYPTLEHATKLASMNPGFGIVYHEHGQIGVVWYEGDIIRTSVWSAAN